MNSPTRACLSFEILFQNPLSRIHRPPPSPFHNTPVEGWCLPGLCAVCSVCLIFSLWIHVFVTQPHRSAGLWRQPTDCCLLWRGRYWCALPDEVQHDGARDTEKARVFGVGGLSCLLVWRHRRRPPRRRAPPPALKLLTTSP